ncbi:MAG TPA: Smr/MutS family protein, partial [Kofleriaceae bacterium]|nr:Smr/MutS family protein [Kofleriaceae bacterium]
LATAPERGKAVVRLGGMHMTVDVGDILIDSHRSARRAAGLADEPLDRLDRPDRLDGPDRPDRGRRRHGPGGPGGPGRNEDGRDHGRGDGSAATSSATSSATSGDVALVDGNAAGRAPGRTPSTTLDVRGQRVDEAVANVERFLDESMLLGHDAVFVVHGHGTGALRAAIRERLAGGHPAVKLARPGEPSEGGDGVTVIALRD